MTATRTKLTEAIEAWQGLSEEEREEAIDPIAEYAAEASKYDGPHPYHIARDLLHAASEPEAKDTEHVGDKTLRRRYGKAEPEAKPDREERLRALGFEDVSKPEGSCPVCGPGCYR